MMTHVRLILTILGSQNFVDTGVSMTATSYDISG